MARYSANYENGIVGFSPSTNNAAPGIAARSGSAVYATEQSRGAKSIRMMAPDTSLAYVQYGNPTELSLDSTSLLASVYFYFTELPAGGFLAIYDDDSANSRPVARLSVNYYSAYARKLFLQDAEMSTSWSSSVAVGEVEDPIPLNRWVRIELYATAAAQNATITAAVFDGDSSVPIERLTSNVARTTAGRLARVRIGKLSESSYPTPFWVDDVLIDTEAPDATKSPYYKWNGTAYKPMSVSAWTGTDYVSVIEE